MEQFFDLHVFVFVLCQFSNSQNMQYSTFGRFSLLLFSARVHCSAYTEKACIIG